MEFVLILAFIAFIIWVGAKALRVLNTWQDSKYATPAPEPEAPLYQRYVPPARKLTEEEQAILDALASLDPVEPDRSGFKKP